MNNNLKVKLLKSRIKKQKRPSKQLLKALKELNEIKINSNVKGFNSVEELIKDLYT